MEVKIASVVEPASNELRETKNESGECENNIVSSSSDLNTIDSTEAKERSNNGTIFINQYITCCY